MRQIAIDFKTSPIGGVGYLGEHNATEIIVAKPADLSGSQYSIAFQTNGEVVHSKYFSADEEIRVSLWQQLTQDNVLCVQLESYDENGAYIGKSATVRLLLNNSVCGTDVVADADNPDVYSEIAQNSSFRETLEDNLNTLDKLTTSPTGELLFNGKPIESSANSINVEVKTETEEEYVLEFITDTETITTPNLIGKQGEKGDPGNDYILTDADKKEIAEMVKPAEAETETIEITNDNLYGYTDNNIMSLMAFDGLTEGKEIVSVELKADENSEWVDLRDMVELDGIPYSINGRKTFMHEQGFVCFGVVSFLFDRNRFYDLAESSAIYSARVTYKV